MMSTKIQKGMLKWHEIIWKKKKHIITMKMKNLHEEKNKTTDINNKTWCPNTLQCARGSSVGGWAWEVEGFCFCYIPPDEFKPVETVIEGVVSCQRALAVLLVRGGHFSGAVVHRSHLVQPLPAGDSECVHFDGSRMRRFRATSCC